jgi:class 3 adenylate cyclase
MELPVTQYARSGDITIAYQEWGAGTPIVWVPGFISHVELNWEAPFFARAFTRAAEFAHMVTFDKRGTGLSDHTADFGSFEQRADDIRAVMDAVGLERAVVGGMSEGGPLALVFAATFPERVEKLVLYATFARFSRAPDYPEGSDAAGDLVSVVEANWGSGEVLKLFAQHAPDPQAEQRLMARFERYTATPQQAAHILGQIGRIDVRAALASIQAPTLVIHCAHDPMIPARNGRYLAEHIASCERYVEFDRDFHASWLAEDSDLLVDVMEEFTQGQVTSTRSTTERVLATVLFTDVVDSTARARDLGDAEWRRLLDGHDRVCEEAVRASRGRVVKTTGDGILATFDGPARAVEAARRIVREVQALGLHVRAGVHTGECELRGDDVSGMAVNLAARVMHDAPDDGVLVTRTVKDLALGSGLVFTPAGERTYKGVPETVAVFTADENALAPPTRTGAG